MINAAKKELFNKKKIAIITETHFCSIKVSFDICNFLFMQQFLVIVLEIFL